MAAANSFMSGFTGGMNSMNNMLDSKMRREALQKQQKQQDALRTFSAISHMYNGMDKEQKQAMQQGVVDKMNANPAVQKILSRNVGHDEQKRISSQFGEMTKSGFVPYVDVVNGKTGEVIRTAPLTEFGTGNPDDPPVVMSQQDFMTTMGKFMGEDDFGRQLGAQILQHGGTLPESPEQFTYHSVNGMRVQRGSKSGEKMIGYEDRYNNKSTAPKLEATLVDEKTNNKIKIWREEDKVIARHFSPQGKLGLVEEITDKWAGGEGGGGSVDDIYNRNYNGTTTQPKNQPGLGVLNPEHLRKRWLADKWSNFRPGSMQ